MPSYFRCTFSLLSTCSLTVSSLLIHPAIAADAQVQGAVTATYLTASDSDVDAETLGVFDMDIDGELGQGRWHIYLEGTSSSNADRVTDVYGEAYADAGAATDENGDGRIQVSNFEVYYPLGNGELVAGLLYPSGFTESGDWSNDETSQFISSSFVNIQTSAAPDYALGVGYQGAISSQLSFSALLSQAQGLGDIDSTYSALLDQEDEYFVSAELVWQVSQFALHTAVWATTLESETFDASDEEKNHGLNISLAHQNALGQVVLRYGIANEAVSEAKQFSAISVQKDIQDFSLGLGLSQTEVSHDYQKVSAADDIQQHEFYTRYQATDVLSLTLSLQKIQNSGFGLSPEYDENPTIFSFRTSAEF
ncbi:hypothetical protein [Bacterioplanoides sp.]|uniref:hypothetical protein n=1 Tax=Bacterioplanoides sp. TaxID=2066072 RepID=UPI003B00F999